MVSFLSPLMQPRLTLAAHRDTTGIRPALAEHAGGALTALPGPGGPAGWHTGAVLVQSHAWSRADVSTTRAVLMPEQPRAAGRHFT